MASGDVNWGIELARAMGHGITQGGFAEFQGGDFGSSFLSAFAGSVTGSAMWTERGQEYFGLPGSEQQIAHRTIAAAIVGGTTSELSGGKFSNGALSAAIVHLFNHEGFSPWTEQDARAVGSAKAVYQEDGVGFEEIGVKYNPRDGFAASVYLGEDGVLLHCNAWN